MGDGVAPWAAALNVFADVALFGEVGALHGAGGGGVVGGAGAPDPVEVEVLEGAGQEQAYGFGAVSVAPDVWVEGEAEGRGPGLVGVQGEAAEPDQLPVVVAGVGDGQGVLLAGGLRPPRRSIGRR